MGAIAATAKNLWGRRHYFRPAAKNYGATPLFSPHCQKSLGRRHFSGPQPNICGGDAIIWLWGQCESDAIIFTPQLNICGGRRHYLALGMWTYMYVASKLGVK